MDGELEIENKNDLKQTLITADFNKNQSNNIESNFDFELVPYNLSFKDVKFEKFEYLQTIPFVIYADFEAIIKKYNKADNDPNKSWTDKEGKHIPSGFTAVVVGFNGKIYDAECYLLLAWLAAFGGVQAVLVVVFICNNRSKQFTFK
jgi:hypothetical protein